jgi:predicted Rossmann fold flavoprotein
MARTGDMKGRSIGIVGAGPAGIIAALEAARLGAQVLLFDQNDAVGRKLLATGNGRCNISNLYAAADAYVCADREFLETALTRYGHPATMARLAELGILTHATADGWCYPLSDSAVSVVDALTAALELAGVKVLLKHRIADIRPTGDRFILTAGAASQAQTVERVIVAAGGKAYPALGSKGELYPILERLGHRVTTIYPALAPIVANVRHLQKLHGVRLDVGLTLYEDDQALGDTVGNLMFTEFGFSGPAPMNLSHLASTRPNASLSLAIDFVPYYREEMLSLIHRKRAERIPLHVVLSAVLPAKVPPVLIQMAGLLPQVRLADVSEVELDHVLDLVTRLMVQVRGTRSFQFAQVSTGGIPVAEVEPRTMASRVVPGLHLAGEVMDVIGPCGGFNLQWAFTSGALAGVGAAAAS